MKIAKKPVEWIAILVCGPPLIIDVMDYLVHGWSAEEMCRQHPYLMPAEVHAALTYYFDHQAAIEAEIEQEWQQVQQARSIAPISPFRTSSVEQSDSS